jgi:ribose transport system permease protein
MVAIQGFVLLYTNEQPGGSAPDSFRWLADGYIGPVPFPVIVVGIVFILGQFVLRRTKLGRYSLAVGGNEEVARLSGIPTLRIRYAAFIISAAGAAITGLFLTARMNIGDPLVGTPFSLDSIAAVVIGGTSISGGRGSVIGTLGGVLLYSTLNNLMNILNVSPFYQITVKGLIIVLAISIYEVRRRSGK